MRTKNAAAIGTMANGGKTNANMTPSMYHNAAPAVNPCSNREIADLQDFAANTESLEGMACASMMIRENSKRPAPKMNFGKHRGHAPDNVNSAYLEWSLEHVADMDGDLHARIISVLRQRGRMEGRR